MDNKPAAKYMRRGRRISPLHKGATGNKLCPPPRNLSLAMMVGVFLGNKSSRIAQVLLAIYLFMLAPLVMFMPKFSVTNMPGALFLMPLIAALIFFLRGWLQVLNAVELLTVGESTEAVLVDVHRTRWIVPVSRHSWMRLFKAHYQVTIGSRLYDAFLSTTEPDFLNKNEFILISPYTGKYTFLKEADSLSSGLGFPTVDEKGSFTFNSEPFIYFGLLGFFVVISWIIFWVQK